MVRQKVKTEEQYRQEIGNGGYYGGNTRNECWPDYSMQSEKYDTAKEVV